MPKQNRKSSSSTGYQKSWEREFPWVIKSKLPFTAECTICKSTFSYKSMGKTALSSHAIGKKHSEKVKNIEKSVPLEMYSTSGKQQDLSSSKITATVPTAGQSTSIGSSSMSKDEPLVMHQSNSSAEKKSSTLDKHLSKENISQAEVRWCILTVMNHMSLRCSESCVTQFPKLFPDSNIASEMKLHKSKISYSITYGLAPYFEKELLSFLKKCDYFVLGFDETLNRISQTQELDATVRFFDFTLNRVRTRYLTSVFLNHSAATDLLEALKKALKGLKMEAILQLSMDGPNVNFKLLRLLKAEREATVDRRLPLDIGSCGLHVIRGAFRLGIRKTEWDLNLFFKCMFALYFESPARRGDFTAITGHTEFPLRFCEVRWVENANVCERAISILPHVGKYVEEVKGTPREPSSKSFKVVSDFLKDKLLPVKLAFFYSLSVDFKPFLVEFQCDAPMAPFLYAELSQLLTNLMNRFVKDDVMAATPVHRIDVLKKNKDNVVANLKRAEECTGVSPKLVLEFRRDCRTCLQFMTVKILERSPLKYPLTEALTFLNPNSVASSPQAAGVCLTNALDIILEANLLSDLQIQNAGREYRSLIMKPHVLEAMKTYDRKERRLDDFWISLLTENEPSDNLNKVVCMLLCLSHGNATLERGFSINDDILVENMRETSLTAQRMIFDAITEAGGADKFEVNKMLVLSMRNAHSRYREAEDERKRKMSQKDKSASIKRQAQQLENELRDKKRLVMKNADTEVAQIDEQIKKLRQEATLL